MNKFATIIASVAALAATGCTSYEIDMPENPDAPVVGNEVSKNIIYQANPRFFGENDCLKALTSHVTRVSDMGCDILWVMPICEPGELEAIGSPYCIRDFKAINPQYGSVADMKALVDAAHAKGMKVILDWIANHTAWDCAWITDHADWYAKDKDGNIAATESWPDVAQLDYSNEAVGEAMKDAMKYWVENTGIDGFRCDYAEGVPHEFWSNLIAEFRAVNPNIIMLAESSSEDFYKDGFDMIYDWECATNVSAAFVKGKTSDAVKKTNDALAKVPAGKSLLRFAFNHDTAASNDVAALYGSYDAVPAAYVVAALSNGTPMIYSSMDVEGLSGKLSFFDYTPLTFSDALTAEYKAINSAFKASAEVRRGELLNYSNESVVCFTRSIPGHKLLVAVNVTGEAQSVKTPIALAGASMTNLIDGSAESVPAALELEGYGYKILMN